MRYRHIPNSIHNIRLIVTIIVSSNIIGLAWKIDTRNIIHWMQWTTYNSLSSHWHLPTLSMKAIIDQIICETSIISDPLLPLYKIFFFLRLSSFCVLYSLINPTTVVYLRKEINGLQIYNVIKKKRHLSPQWTDTYTYLLKVPITQMMQRPQSLLSCHCKSPHCKGCEGSLKENKKLRLCSTYTFNI